MSIMLKLKSQKLLQKDIKQVKEKEVRIKLATAH